MKSKSVRKTQDQLKQELSLKIKGIKAVFAQSIKCELESDERLEYSNIIASSLRAILYGDKNNNNQSLIHRVGLDKKMLFPLYNPNICLSVMPTYNLLQFSISNDGAKVSLLDDLFKTGGMWGLYLTFDSWLNEVVIDTKLKDVEPLSRLLIVKIIADTTGAHVDDEIERHIFEMSKHDLLPVVVINGVEVPRDLEAKTKSIFCETIIAIAKELIDAYDMWLGVAPKLMGLSNTIVRVQKYVSNNSKYELLKFGTVKKGCPYEINTYNSNSFYECDIYSKEVPLFAVIKNNKRFIIRKVDYSTVLKGDYLGKSIYPST